MGEDGGDEEDDAKADSSPVRGIKDTTDLPREDIIKPKSEHIIRPKSEDIITPKFKRPRTSNDGAGNMPRVPHVRCKHGARVLFSVEPPIFEDGSACVLCLEAWWRSTSGRPIMG